MSEKTEKATAWKLQKAREKGQVCKSVELNTCIFLLITSNAIAALLPASLQQIQQILRGILAMSGDTHFSSHSIMQVITLASSTLLALWLPICLAAFVSLIVGNIGQTGFIWTFQPVKPSWNRLNPVQGWKKIFSTKTLFDLLKNAGKLLLAFLCVFLALQISLSKIAALSQFTSLQAYAPLWIIFKIILQLLVTLTGIALVDVLYNRYKFAKDQRMSKQEVRDEYKQKEGCPQIKSRIRQLQNQLRKKTASLQAIKKAQVLITNPTHLAIALQYQPNMPAPMVVCKAADVQVEIVKQLARKHGVPIVEHKPLAWLLFHNIGLNQWITPDLYPVVAEVLRKVLAEKETT